MELDKNLRRLYNDFRRAAAYQVNSRATTPTIKGTMKFSSQGLFVATALFSSVFTPIAHSCIVRCALVIGTCVFLLCMVEIDRWIRRTSDFWRSRRIETSNFFAITLALLPIALRCVPGTWTKLVFDCLAYSGCVCLIAFGGAARLDPLLQMSGFKFRKALPSFFFGACGIYLVVIGIQATAFYNSYSTEWVDFSFGFPPIWQTPRYGFLRFINEFSVEKTILCAHWPLIYSVLSPITLFWKSPSSVLWLQTFFFVASAYTVYLLARHYLESKSHAYLIGAIFLFYVPVHLANLFDFHADPLAMPFIFLMFLFAAKNEWKKYWICVVCGLCCIEYVGLALVGFGILLSFKNRKIGFTTAAVGLFWLFLVLKVGIPFVNKGMPPTVIALNYGDIGGSQGLLGILIFTLTHPLAVTAKLLRQTNITAVLSLFLPFLFLSLRKPWVLAAGIAILIKNALSGSGVELLAHRETLFIPFVVYAFILCMADITDHSLKRFYLLAVTIAVGVTFFLQGHAFPTRGFWNLRNQYIKSPHDKICDRLMAKIPDTSAVMSSSHIAPHLMARKWYFLFPRFPTPVKPEYIVVDTLEQADWDWLSRKESMKGFRSIKRSQDYYLIEEENGIFLFKSRRF